MLNSALHGLGMLVVGLRPRDPGSRARGAMGKEPSLEHTMPGQQKTTYWCKLAWNARRPAVPQLLVPALLADSCPRTNVRRCVKLLSERPGIQIRRGAWID
jgi:hypothetical protein